MSDERFETARAYMIDPMKYADADEALEALASIQAELQDMQEQLDFARRGHTEFASKYSVAQAELSALREERDRARDMLVSNELWVKTRRELQEARKLLSLPMCRTYAEVRAFLGEGES